MSISKTLVPLAVLALVIVSAHETLGQGFADAQVNQFRRSNSAAAFTSERLRRQVTSRAIGRFGVAGVNATDFSRNRPKKPFQGLNRGPAVSPYLSLSGSLNSVSDYYNVVQPRQEFDRERRRQDAENQRAQQAILANQQRLTQIAARPPFDITGDQTTVPTGHTTTYMTFHNYQNTGNFFTPMQGLNKQNP